MTFTTRFHKKEVLVITLIFKQVPVSEKKRTKYIHTHTLLSHSTSRIKKRFYLKTSKIKENRNFACVIDKKICVESFMINV